MGEEGVILDRRKCTGCGACEKACPAAALTLKGKIVPAGEVMKELRKDEVFYRSSGGGITFSGGEPLMQPDFLIQLAEQCRREGYHTAMETTGYASRKTMGLVLPHIDLFLFDLKCIDEMAHRAVTGVSNRMILENLKLLIREGKELVLRVPVVPGYTDTEKNLMEIGEFAASNRIREINLLPYHNYGEAKYMQLGRAYDLDGVPTMKKEDLREWKDRLASFGLLVKIGG